MMKVKNIIFTGPMGSGRGIIARALAKGLDLVFLDNDGLIEMKLDQKISEILKEKGETFFRQEEQKVANFLYFRNGASIASGGGFIRVSDFDKIGLCIYLKASSGYLKERLNENEIVKRSLFYNEAQAKGLYNEHLSKYEQKTNLILDAENKSIDEFVIEIKKAVK